MTSARPQSAPLGCASEEHVQNAARAVLDELGLLWAHPPNEALQRGGALYGCFLVGQGVKAGLPDCLIFTPAPARPDARGVALELKTVRGALSDEQKRWLAGLERAGWVCAAPRGTVALLDALRGLGWPVDDALQRLAARGETIDETGALRVDAAKAKRWAQAQRAQRAGSTT